jgi:hypothetical protein
MILVDVVFKIEFAEGIGLLKQLTHNIAWAANGVFLWCVINKKKEG